MVSLYQEARAVLHESRFTPRKRFGQNFLVQESVIDRILRMAEVSPEDEILEIGPGLGFVTRRLLATGCEVTAVEIDPILAGRLRQTMAEFNGRFHLIVGDVLKTPIETILAGKKVKLIANLPYSISTAILFRIFEFRRHFSSLVLMVQREVADRMVAVPGSKSYGALSVSFQVHGEVLEQWSVSPEAFFPRPKVWSKVLKIALRPNPLVASENEATFQDVVRGAFGQRRKTLHNALAASLGLGRSRVDELLQSAAIDPRRRGETLQVEEFLRLTRLLRQVRF